MKKIVIVGGVAGGASAAARARRMSETADIVMLDRGPYVSFANCGLPYHVSGEIASRDALVLQTPESFKARFNVDVRLQSEVVSIDRNAKTVQVKNVCTGETYDEAYDVLLLSPGAAPVIPPIPGIDNSLTFSLRNIPDMDRILGLLDQRKVNHATVVGGGFIGLEMAEALKHRGIDVTLLELADQVMSPVDKEMASYAHRELIKHGVDLRLSTGLQQVEQAEDQLTLHLSNGDTQATDMLLMAIGVRPETKLAADAELRIGSSGGIWVDEQMRTSDQHIFAVGDAVEETHLVSGADVLVPLAGPANRQGRIAADNMLGAERTYNKTQGTGICRIFDLAVASTGMCEKQLKRSGMDYDKVYVHAASHASYYPGSEQINLKVLFEPATGKLLGAQAVGKDGADKRIDVLAVAIRAGMTVYDLEDLELTYAPPYGSAKDVVNLAGFVAANQLREQTKLWQVEDLENFDADKQLIVDVRNPWELERNGTVFGGELNGKGLVNIPLDSLRDRLAELPRDKELLVLCQVGLRGHVAQRMLVNSGFDAKNLTGGYNTYQAWTWSQENA